MRFELKFSVEDMCIDGEWVIGYIIGADEAVLESARKVTQKFFETFTSKESALEESDVSFHIQNGMEMCHPSCELAQLAQLSNRCERGCRWTKSLVLQIKVQSNDPKKNLVIACLIKTFMEGWHTVEGFEFNFTKGILRVVSDNHDDAVNDSNTVCLFCGEQKQLDIRPVSDQEGYIVGYVKFGNMTVFEKRWGEPFGGVLSYRTLGGNGGPFCDIRKVLNIKRNVLKRDGVEHAQVAQEITRIRETEAMKEADLREAVRNDVVNNILTLTDDVFGVCAQLWQKPRAIRRLSFSDDTKYPVNVEDKVAIGVAAIGVGSQDQDHDQEQEQSPIAHVGGELEEGELEVEEGELDDDALEDGERRTIITATITTSNSTTYDMRNSGHFLLLKHMEDWKKRKILTNNANLIKNGFFKTFNVRRWLSPNMVSFRIEKISDLVIVINVPHRTEEAVVMVISALLAAFIYDYHGLRWDTFRLNGANNFSLNVVATNRVKKPTEATTMRITRPKILCQATIEANLKKLGGNVFEYMRNMANLGR